MAQRTGPADRSPEDWYRCGEWDLAARQLQAIAALHHARAIAAWAAAARARSRQAREADARRLEVLRRTHDAVVARAQLQLQASGVRRPAPTLHGRVLVADRRSPAFSATLEQQGMRVVAQVNDGPDAIGIALVEQPDVVVVGDPLAVLTSDEVVRDVRSYSPRSSILAVAATPERAQACCDEGATVVLVGTVSTPDLVMHLRALVQQRAPGPR